MADGNPKRDADPNANIEKDRDDWVSGDDSIDARAPNLRGLKKGLSKLSPEPGT